MADPGPKNIALASGETVTCRWEYSMWRADVLGYHYCSPTFDGLLSAIGYLHPIRREDPNPPLPPPTTEQLFLTAPSLADRQAAFVKLTEMARNGDAEATALVFGVETNIKNSLADATAVAAEIKKTLPENYSVTASNINNAALTIAKTASQPDLAYVPPAAILNSNYDVVMRNAVLRLLAKRFDLNARS